MLCASKTYFAISAHTEMLDTAKLPQNNNFSPSS